MTEAVLITGGNRGDVRQTLQLAREAIAARIGRVTTCSRCCESAPWGFDDAQPFWNQVVAVETALDAETLLARIHEIEAAYGRDREAEADEKRRSGARYTGRTLDIDILFYGGEVIDRPGLQIPHPAMSGREFVLRPLCEVMPERRHPVTGKTVREMLEELLHATIHIQNRETASGRHSRKETEKRCIP